MDIKFHVAGLHIDYRREKIILQSLIITENRLSVYLHRTWNNLDFDAMIKTVNNCCVLKKLKKIYYDKYSLSGTICKKLDDRFRPIPMNHNNRCNMVETVKFWASTISCNRNLPFYDQRHFLHPCKNSQEEVIGYPVSNIFMGNVEAFCLAIYGYRKVISKYTKTNNVPVKQN